MCRYVVLIGLHLMLIVSYVLDSGSLRVLVGLKGLSIPSRMLRMVPGSGARGVTASFGNVLAA